MNALPRMLRCAALAVSVAATAQEPDPLPDPPPPWEAAAAELSQTLALTPPKHLQRYDRYQRVALVGTPFYLAGMSMVGWASYQIIFLNAGGNVGVGLTLGTGTLVSLGGAGAMAWGSHSAAMALFNDDPRPGQIIAGRIAYGMLGVGSAAIAVEYFLGGALGPAGLALGLTGLGSAVGSGIPGLIQMTKNTKMRDRQLEPMVTVLPRQGGMTVALVGRF